ncbi:MAG TPA: SAM-dependent methyltransferase [Acetobacteraceae bacterium]|nr:SAM-dependent methyltransferase [Acetobacteraceae bacterium]
MSGDERLDRFMARANAAYYATQDPFADFTTAPEIAQAFGEVLGLWAAVVWKQLGRPDPVLLAEAGPGRGTLMADALRAAARAAPTFRTALRVHLIETSPRLRLLQAEAVPEAAWHERLEDLPPGSLILLANEFLDALPIRQFVRRGAGWAERWIEAGRFAERPVRALPPDIPPTAPEGAVLEHSEAAHAFIGALAQRLARAPGAALFLDYGPAESTVGDSLQAIRAGRPADPLAEPGGTDLTAHVDFAALARAARAAGAAVYGPVPQGVFLTRLGLMQRTDRLARTQPPAKALALIDAARRLVEPDRMGRLFKALALTSPGSPAPPGFAEGA